MTNQAGLKNVIRVGLLVALLVSTTLSISRPQRVQALCMQPREEGRWVNADSNTRSFPEIRLRFVCQDQVHNGEPYPPGPPWYVHLFGKCHPTNCDWGEVGAKNYRGYIYAFYDQGFAKRHVYVRMSQYRPGQLWVYTWTDFTDPGRADYATNDWFVRG